MPTLTDILPIEPRIISLEARVTTMEKSVADIHTGLTGTANTPGVYEQVRGISTAVDRMKPQMDRIEVCVESYKSNVWYVRGFGAAIAAGAFGIGWIVRYFVGVPH